MKQIYTNENMLLANNVKNIIEAEGIAVFIKNEFSQGAVGEISIFDSWPEVWVVNDADFSRAKEIVELSNRRENTVDWHCEKCSESNDSSFEICWKCNEERNV